MTKTRDRNVTHQLTRPGRDFYLDTVDHDIKRPRTMLLYVYLVRHCSAFGSITVNNKGAMRWCKISSEDKLIESMVELALAGLINEGEALCLWHVNFDRLKGGTA